VALTHLSVSLCSIGTTAVNEEWMKENGVACLHDTVHGVVLGRLVALYAVKCLVHTTLFSS
jgi:hypothetical protein